MMRILYINNDGAGFADQIEIEEQTTVEQLFQQRVTGRASDYLIRVNRQPAAANQALQPGDRVSFTPMKIEGAGSM
jgi:sulfur carrier protein ThiS